MNFVTHTVGGGLGIAIAALCIVFSFTDGDGYKIVSSFIYGISMIILYTVSSVYHGLDVRKAEKGKKVMRIIDHCTIFLLICGTYTPFALVALRERNAALGWGVFAVVYGLSVVGIVFTAIDVKKYIGLSIALYLVIGWCIVFTGKNIVEAIGHDGFMYLLLGGIAYSVGAILYVLGKKLKLRYAHSVFHIFVIFGSVLQFFAVLFYVIIN